MDAVRFIIVKMFILLLVIQCIIISQIVVSQRAEISFIKDYVKDRVSLRTITAFWCWNFGDLKYLMQAINQNNVRLSLHNAKTDYYRYRKLLNNLYIADLSCNETIGLLTQANQGPNFQEPNHWIIFQNNSSATHSIFNNIKVLINSNIVLVHKLNQEDFILKYVYKLNKSSEVIYDKFASWNKVEGFTSFDKSPISWRRRNLNRYLLKIASVVQYNETYDHMTDYRQNEIDTLSKLNYVLTHILLDYMNASVTIKYYNTWYRKNTRNQSGTFIGAIVNREIDITGSPFFCMADRLIWMDCISMTSPAEGFFVFRQPPLSYVKNIYILPFGKNLWLTDIAFLLISVLILYVVVLWEWKLIQENNTEPEIDMIHATLSDSLLFTVGAVCQQGYSTEPKGTPGKILLLTVFITLIFIFTAYTAYIVVLFQATSNDIKTLKDLYHSDIGFGTEDKDYLQKLLSVYGNELSKKIYAEKIVPKGQPANYYNLQEGVEKIRHEYFAFHIEQISGYKVINDLFLENEKCDLQQITYIDAGNPWIVAPKRNPFKEIYKVVYCKLHERGFRHREIRKRIAQKPVCSSKGNNFRSAGVIDLYAIYMLLLIGICSSLLIFVAEIITSFFVKRYTKSQIK